MNRFQLKALPAMMFNLPREMININLNLYVSLLKQMLVFCDTNWERKQTCCSPFTLCRITWEDSFSSFPLPQAPSVPRRASCERQKKLECYHYRGLSYKVIKLLNQNSYYHFPSRLHPENTKSELKDKTSEASPNVTTFLC